VGLRLSYSQSSKTFDGEFRNRKRSCGGGGVPTAGLLIHEVRIYWNYVIWVHVLGPRSYSNDLIFRST